MCLIAEQNKTTYRAHQSLPARGENKDKNLLHNHGAWFHLPLTDHKQEFQYFQVIRKKALQLKRKMGEVRMVK